jgi:hypothetical protein
MFVPLASAMAIVVLNACCTWVGFPKTKGLEYPCRPMVSATSRLQSEIVDPLSWMALVSNCSAEVEDNKMTGVGSREIGDFALVRKATASVFSCQASCRAILCFSPHFLTPHHTGDQQSAALWFYLRQFMHLLETMMWSNFPFGFFFLNI